MNLTEEYTGATLPPDLDYSDPKVVAAFTAAADHFRKTNKTVIDEFAYYRAEIAMLQGKKEILKERLWYAEESISRGLIASARFKAKIEYLKVTRRIWAMFAIALGVTNVLMMVHV